MEKVVETLSNDGSNIENIKTITDIIGSIFTVLISVIATIIAYKGYKKAKIGLLSPMKSAVVTIQTDLFVNLVNYLSKDFFDDESELYSEIAFLNIYEYLISCGYIFKDMDYLKEKLRKETKLRLINPNLDDNQIDEIEVIMPFSSKDKNYIEKNYSKEKYASLKNGQVKIQLISVGMTYLKVSDELGKYTSNPLIPEKIRQRIIQINKNIMDNINRPLINEIEGYLIKIVEEDNIKEGINITGVYNMFNRKRISQTKDKEYTIKAIREYLHVDEEWV